MQARTHTAHFVLACVCACVRSVDMHIHAHTRPAFTPLPRPLPAQYETEDTLMAGMLFELLGVGLGKQEMYGIALAVKKLGEDPKRGVQTVRFFGKFFGLHADYYVFETTLKEPSEIPEAPGGWAGCAHRQLYECVCTHACMCVCVGGSGVCL